MQNQGKALHTSRIAADLFVILVSFLFAVFSSPTRMKLELTLTDGFLLFLLILVWLFSTRVTFLYDEFRSRNYSFELITVLRNILVQFFTAVLFLFLTKVSPLSRVFVITYSVSLLLLLSIEKFMIRRLLDSIRKKGKNQRSMLIIGAGTLGRRFYETVKANPHFGYSMLGFLDDEKSQELNGRYLGKIELLEDILEYQQVDDVIIALPKSQENRIEDVINVCEKYFPRVRIIPDYFKFLSNKYNISMFEGFPVISVRDDRLSELHWSLLKRTFDIVFSLLLFILVFSWLWPVIMIAIKINAGGQIFFKQERWGKNNRRFITYKFRSMRQHCREFDKNGNFMQVTKNDPRVTAVGRILRKTNLDELPQFLNVLKGDMSIVGPRPHVTPLNLESRESIKGYMQRHLVQPGITGWAQVNGLRGEIKDPCLMQKRVEHDLWYIENWSFWLDLQIIILTIVKMFKGDPNAY